MHWMRNAANVANMQRKQKRHHACNFCGLQRQTNIAEHERPRPATSCHTDFFPQLHFKQNPLGFFALTAVTHIRITHTQSVPFPTKYE